MGEEKIQMFLNEMFKNRNLFLQVHGLKYSNNPKYMLVADHLSENVEAFSKVVYAFLSNTKNSCKNLSSSF